MILDVSDPRNVNQISVFNDGLTGGVHNLFIYKDHVYALSNGERYDIINIEDPKHPHKVGSFELDEPGHAIHDVWIEDGIAYSSNWTYGVQMVDIAMKMGRFAFQSGKSGQLRLSQRVEPCRFPFKSLRLVSFTSLPEDEAFPMVCISMTSQPMRADTSM